MLSDSTGRKIEYMRMSLTQRCNLKCVYCMTGENENLNDENAESFMRIAKLMALCGIKHIRLTGGEPLLYNDIEKLIWELKNTDGIETVTLTTNGVELNEKLDGLLKSGIDGINVSIDACSRYSYKEITGFDCFDKVYDAVCRAAEKTDVKINCVPIFSKNIIPVTEIAKKLPVSVRFIELMPFGPAINMKGLNEESIRKIIEGKFGKLYPSSQKHGFGPARYFSIDGFNGDIGFISAITHKFCENCNRIRVTSDLKLKTCIQYPPVLDLKLLLNDNDSMAAKKIIECIQNKPLCHTFEEYKNTCPMFRIGG